MNMKSQLKSFFNSRSFDGVKRTAANMLTDRDGFLSIEKAVGVSVASAVPAMTVSLAFAATLVSLPITTFVGMTFCAACWVGSDVDRMNKWRNLPKPRTPS